MKSRQSPTCPDCDTMVIRCRDTDNGELVEEYLWCSTCSDIVTEPMIDW
jgi:hypothetical protein